MFLESLKPQKIASCPDGYIGFALHKLFKSKGPLLHIAKDDRQMASLASALEFIDPEVRVLTIPAWDCLPYDRNSPRPDISAKRMEAFSCLPTNGIVITTLNSLLQRIPPESIVRGFQQVISKDASLDIENFISTLPKHGYFRSSTVRETGEYAVRGGIIDIFPSGSDIPYRIDLFGDTVDSIRTFDPMSQRSLDHVTSFSLGAVGEVQLDAEAIDNFRSTYIKEFGAKSTADQIYTAITSGQKPSGFEHYLPLFYPEMGTIVDIIGCPTVSVDHHIQQELDNRYNDIEDYYQTRKTYLIGKQNEQAYRPLPPEKLYILEPELLERLKTFNCVAISPFTEDGEDLEHAGAKSHTSILGKKGDQNASIYTVLTEIIKQARSNKKKVLICVSSIGVGERIVKNLSEIGSITPVCVQNLGDIKPVSWSIVDIEHGFETDTLLLLTEQDIFGERQSRPRRRIRKPEMLIQEASSLQQGDYIVHEDHGIGQFISLETVSADGSKHDCLLLHYHGNDKLFLPVENLSLLSRYGSEDSNVKLDKLGAAGWQARKSKVKERIKEIAADLLKIAVERKLRKGEIFRSENEQYENFAAKFPYTETDDQNRAISETLNDLKSGIAMDRLVCGDVGFGKTEIAMRAAFAVANSGKQVAIVVPTTLLCHQHFKNFQARFLGSGITVASLSRLVSAKDKKIVQNGLTSGDVNIVIGTHSLLSKNVNFKNLGLVIIDEEQHFGVTQKERLKHLKSEVHVLTLTATPIPRTLQMAMTGVRDMSIIATPPVDRLAVRTFVNTYDPVIIKEAIEREVHRGGQVFYVCPRVADLGKVFDELQEIVPDVRVACAHGQMPATELEKVMLGFSNGESDVLLSTNIVESGIDIPSANTMIIHRADRFGLAQLYQLRGRIGRSKTRAYAYLTLPINQPLSDTAQKRLEVMQSLDSLGAGFQLASYDLDIRGAGNLLGDKQSGHIQEVGVELYQQMLSDALEEAQKGSQKVDKSWTPQINMGIPVFIPEEYVDDLSVRLGLYRRLSYLETSAEIEDFASEMIDRFGSIPDEVQNLLFIMELKQRCRKANIEKIDAGIKGAVVTFRNDQALNPEKLMGYIQQNAGVIKIRPDQKMVYMGLWNSPGTRMKAVSDVVAELVEVSSTTT
ncbi:MAG: transcription-repair coupling factor [Alphaproteobacteria bacterium]